MLIGLMTKIPQLWDKNTTTPNVTDNQSKPVLMVASGGVQRGQPQPVAAFAARRVPGMEQTEDGGVLGVGRSRRGAEDSRMPPLRLAPLRHRNNNDPAHDLISLTGGILCSWWNKKKQNLHHNHCRRHHQRCEP